MRSYFFGSGVLLAVLYMIAAAFLMRIFGVELTRYWTTMMMAAGVMLGGTYAIIMFVYLFGHLALRWKRGEPLMERED